MRLKYNWSKIEFTPKWKLGNISTATPEELNNICIELCTFDIGEIKKFGMRKQLLIVFLLIKALKCIQNGLR